MFLDGTKDAQAAHVDKSLQGSLSLEDGMDEVFRPLVVDSIEVFLVKTLGSAGCVNNIVEFVIA